MTLRKVTLWSMTPTEYIVGGYELMRHKNTYRCIPFPNGEFAEPLDVTVQIERMPIHCISRIERRTRIDEYIAIEPSLHEVLELPIRTKYDEAMERERKITASTRMQRDEFALKLDYFTDAPWYVCVWRLLRAR